MCGFTAIFAPNARVERETLQASLATLHHRGPDSQQIWISRDEHIGLGHARLSIIDLNTGDQPIASQDGSLQIVVNGEFYGFEAIRAELEAAGHRFRTHSDSEIALHLYEDLGVQCLHRLRGEFAMVIWDARNHTLIAARDRFGIKPLFFSWHAGALYLASEAKALFAAGVPATWDEESVMQMHTGRLLSPSRSLFKGVEQVPPGHVLIATPSQRRLVRYWDFNYPVADSPLLIRDPQEALQLFKAKFDEAVQLRLRADVPVACYLSGGLDSCSILGTANRLARQPVHAFTLTFQAGHYDEGAVAEEMARHAGSPYFPLHVTSRDLADNLADALWHGETPLMNAHAVAKFMLSRFVRDHGFKVVLTGEGSDEILGGYVHFRQDWLAHNSGITDPYTREQMRLEMERNNALSRPLLLAMAGPDALPLVQKQLGFVPSFMLTGMGSGGAAKRMLAPDLRARFNAWDPYRSFFNEVDVRGQLTGREPVNQSLYLWSKTTLPNYLLTVLGDRMEMAHSIEGRVPFLDHELVELMTRIPVSEKIKAMREKHLLREAVRADITDTVYRREKHPFIAPPMSQSKDPELQELIHDTLRGSTLANVGFYDRKSVLNLLDESAAGSDDDRARIDAVIMTVVSFAIMQERLGVH